MKTVEQAFEKISELLGEGHASTTELLQTLAFVYFCKKDPEQKQQQFRLQIKYLFGDSPSKSREQLETTAIRSLSNLINMIPSSSASRGWADYTSLCPTRNQVAIAENLRSLAKASKEFAKKEYNRGLYAEFMDH